MPGTRPTQSVASRWTLRVSVAAIVAGLLGGCNDGEVTWARFNADGDVLEVDVGGTGPVPQDAACADEDPDGLTLCEKVTALDGTAVTGDDLGCICLASSLRANDVGTATVDPTYGPVGTRHTVRVEVLDEFQDIVQRVSVYTTGQRDDEEIELRQDSADPGSWAVELESQGTSDETRTDRFELRLYEPDGTFSGTVETTEE